MQVSNNYMTALEVGLVSSAAIAGAIIGSKVLMLGAVFAALILYVQARMHADHTADIATKTMGKVKVNAHDTSEDLKELGESQELAVQLFQQMQEQIGLLQSQIAKLKQHQVQVL